MNETLSNYEDKLHYVLKKLNKSPEELTRDVAIIKNWFIIQKHLPESPNDNVIISFLLINKFSIEVTKQKLDMYYTVRQLLPEFFQNKNPKLPHMQNVLENAYILPLPKLTKDFYRVTLYGLNNDKSEKFNYCNFVALMYNICEIRLNEDLTLGEIVVYNFKNLTLSHLAQITPTLVKKVIFILEKVYSNNLKQIHYLNVPGNAEKLLNLVKGMLKEKIANRIFIHKDETTLFNYIDKEILPTNLGGEENSIDKLTEFWRNKFIEYQKRFDALDSMKVNEKLREKPLNNDEVLGVYGSFKSIEVD